MAKNPPHIEENSKTQKSRTPEFVRRTGISLSRYISSSGFVLKVNPWKITKKTGRRRINILGQDNKENGLRWLIILFIANLLH